MRLLFLAPALLAQLTPDQLREDLRIARQALEEGHPGVYRYTPKAEFQLGFEQAEAKLTRPMTPLEFGRVLTPAVNLVKCGHTSLNLPQGYQLDLKLLPFDIDILEGRVYIVSDPALAGAEILEINGVPAASLLKQFEASTPGDGNIAVGRWGRLARGGFLRALPLIAGIDTPYRVTYKLRGAKKTAEFAGVAATQRPPDAKPLASLEFPGDGKIAVLTIRTFGGFADRERKLPLSKFMTDAFGEIGDRRAAALILDLRGNGGGQDALGKQLMAHLTDHDFGYYKDLVVNARSFSFKKHAGDLRDFTEAQAKPRADGRFDVLGHPNLGPQKPAKPGFRGRVIAIADRDSFSATGEFLTAFHTARRGTIVGEETGAAYLGNTSGASALVTLPNSKLRLIVPLMGYYLPSSRNAAPDRGVMPDVPVKLTIEDKIAQRDPAMQRAMELAARPAPGAEDRRENANQEP